MFATFWIVNEVLAVGEASFQKSCLGKMIEISNEGGRTILFVSHRLQVVQKLCNISLYLQNGKLIKNGSIDKIVDGCIQNAQDFQVAFDFPKTPNQFHLVTLIRFA